MQKINKILISLKIFFKPISNFLVNIGNILGLIKSKILIGFLFFCIFYPIGIIGKFFGKEFLEKKIDKNRGTYFEKTSKEIHSFDEQF